MKRESTQKVNSIPSCAADNDTQAKLSPAKLSESVSNSIRSNPIEVNRLSRRSAALIGLAISMSASSLLLPAQGDEAMAASDPVAAEPTVTTVPALKENTVAISPSPKVEPESATVSKSPEGTTQGTPSRSASVGVEKQAKQGQTLWHISQKNSISTPAVSSPIPQRMIESENNHDSIASQPQANVLKAPSKDIVVTQLKAADRSEVTRAKSEQFEPVIVTGNYSGGESVTSGDNRNGLLKAKQDIALDNLKERHNRLQQSLAELKSEESTTNSSLTTAQPSTEAQEANTVSQPSQAEAASVPLITAPQVMVANPTLGKLPVARALGKEAASSQVNIPVELPETIAPSPVATSGKVKTASSVVNIPVPLPEIQRAVPQVIQPGTESIPNIAEPVNIPASSTKTSVPTAAVAEPQAAQTAVLYQVKPGDTLDAIAQAYGVPSSQLTRINGLQNPNLIRVNQNLQIPQPQVVPVITAANPRFTSASPEVPVVATAPSSDVVTTPTVVIPTTSSNRALRHNAAINKATFAQAPVEIGIESANVSPQVPLETTAPSVDIPTVPIAVIPTRGQEPVLRPKVAITKATPIESVVETSVSSENFLIGSEVPQPATSKSNPVSPSNLYIDKLRLEINKLRQQYQFQTGNNGNVRQNTTVPIAVQPPTPSLNSASLPSRYINPEFSPNQYREALESENRSLQQKRVEQGSIQIQVPAPEMTMQRNRQSLVASTPTTADTYNPAIRTPIGSTVSPELPNLPGPNPYLPDSPYQFNGYIWPTQGVITSGYGRRWGRMHKGIDIAGPVGTPVYAAGPGVVIYARWNTGGYGNLVDIQHPDGTITRYGHNHRIVVGEGQQVAQGQQISEMGNTGRSTGPHLHFEIHPAGKDAVNPIAFLPSR